MRLRGYFFVVVLVLVAGSVQAENQIKWDSDPKVDDCGGMQEIKLEGSFSLDTGWRPEETVLVHLWKDGELVAVETGSVSCNSWTCNIPVVAAGTYNVTVEGMVVDGVCGTETIRTSPKTVTVP